MAESAKSNISQAITALKSSVESGSVTPLTVGKILDLINDFADTVNADLETFKTKAATRCTVAVDPTYNRITLQSDTANLGSASRATLVGADWNNAGLMTAGNYQRLLSATTKEETPSIAFATYFNAAFNDGIEYCPRNRNTRECITSGNYLKNGYYASGNAADGWSAGAPYCAYGFWLAEAEAMCALFRPWHIGMEGVMMSARANIPLATKSSDSRLNLDYCSVNNGEPYVIALGNKGWESEIEPRSMWRAFHGNYNLKAIIGIINMQSLTDKELSHTLENNPSLEHFHVRNVPDAITRLDLSTCGDIFSPNYYGTTTEGFGGHASSFEYLCQHYNDFGLRTTPLQIVISEDAYASNMSAVGKYSMDSLLEITTPGE